MQWEPGGGGRREGIQDAWLETSHTQVGEGNSVVATIGTGVEGEAWLKYTTISNRV